MKKLLLSLSTVTMAIVPLTTVIACGKKSEDASEELTIEQVAAELKLTVGESFSTVLATEIKNKTSWVNGASEISRIFGITLPSNSSRINIRAKYVPSTATMNSTGIETLKLVFELSRKPFTDAAATIIMAEIGIRAGSDVSTVAFGVEAEKFKKAFTIDTKSTLTAQALGALSITDQKDWTKIGLSYTFATGYSYEVSEFELDNALAKNGTMIGLIGLFKKDNLSIELDIKAVSSDFTRNYDAPINIFKLAAETTFFSGDTNLPVFQAESKIPSLTELVAYSEEFSEIYEMVIAINKLGFEVETDITVVSSTNTKLEITIVFKSSMTIHTASAKTIFSKGEQPEENNDQEIVDDIKTQLDALFTENVLVSSKNSVDLTATPSSLTYENFVSELGLSLTNLPDLNGATITFDGVVAEENNDVTKPAKSYDLNVRINKGEATTKTSYLKVSSKDLLSLDGKEVMEIVSAFSSFSGNITSLKPANQITQNTTFGSSALSQYFTNPALPDIKDTTVTFKIGAFTNGETSGAKFPVTISIEKGNVTNESITFNLLSSDWDDTESPSTITNRVAVLVKSKLADEVDYRYTADGDHSVAGKLLTSDVSLVSIWNDLERIGQGTQYDQPSSEDLEGTTVTFGTVFLADGSRGKKYTVTIKVTLNGETNTSQSFVLRSSDYTQ